MAPFSIPAPCIIPLRLPTFGARRTIDNQTRIELICDTNIDHEIFYTLDGTRPQPYAGIVQGSRLFKYTEPFFLAPGKVTVKALALHSLVRSMRSSVVTKSFEVLRCESEPAVPKKIPKKLPRKKKVGRKSDCRGALVGTVDDLVDLDFEDGDKKDLYVDDPCSSVEDFAVHSVNGEDSIHSEGSVASVTEMENPLNMAKFESDQDVSPCSSAPQSPQREHTANEDGFGDSVKVENKACSCDMKSESPSCIKCEVPLQYCSTCNTANASTSKYCVQCGQRLMLECVHCNETNYVIATFCQFCGQKMQSPEDFNVPGPPPKVPQRCHASVQKSPSLSPKHTQTSPLRKKLQRPLPSHSPGRGYWHLQLDYICNHLKSYAYNNTEFRDSISEPVLGDFQTATVTKSEDSVSITVAFTPFTLGEKV